MDMSKNVTYRSRNNFFKSTRMKVFVLVFIVLAGLGLFSIINMRNYEKVDPRKPRLVEMRAAQSSGITAKPEDFTDSVLQAEAKRIAGYEWNIKKVEAEDISAKFVEYEEGFRAYGDLGTKDSDGNGTTEIYIEFYKFSTFEDAKKYFYSFHSSDEKIQETENSIALKERVETDDGWEDRQEIIDETGLYHSEIRAW